MIAEYFKLKLYAPGIFTIDFDLISYYFFTTLHSAKNAQLWNFSKSGILSLIITRLNHYLGH